MMISSVKVITLGIIIPLISFANGGPPLQSEIPMDIYPEHIIPTSIETETFDEKEATYRLPLSVRPIKYDLEIRPIIDQPDEGDPDIRFTAPGKVVIHVKCYEATRNITLHSKEIEIDHDSVTVRGIEPAGDVVVTEPSFDETRSFYIINLASELQAEGEYLVTIPFTARLADDRLNGLYLSSYKANDGSTKYLATTQFQKADASKAFPCFDEPSDAFRANFTVKIGRKAVGYHSLGNTEKDGDPQPIPGKTGWVWDLHKETVNMPPYLIAIIVSDFESETAPEGLYTKPVRTWAAPPLMTETSGKFSAQAAARILTFFEKYFDYPYQLSKMDSVAIPDFAAGAMENWGLNTYRTNLMVWFPEENTMFEKWASARVIAHELVHQWFGNLVTCEWWSQTYLNEGFARYFQYIGANNSVGEDLGFRALDRYVIDVTQLAMAYDESETTEPVASNITDRIVNQATRIAYEKGAALLRMMQSFLTEDTLIKGLRKYLKRHAYSGVVQDYLFAALTEQAVEDGTFTEYTVKEVMDTWTLQSGFPLVRVSRVDPQRLYLSQERYRADPTKRKDSEEELWYVPITYASASNPDFSLENARPKAWIDNETILQTLTVESTDEWIIINPEARAFYRVIYDSYLTSLIQSQLERDHTQISLAARSQLIDDYFRSASAKYIPIQSALNMTRYLKNEDDFIVWTTVVNNFTPLYTLLTDTDAFSSFRSYVLSLVVDPLKRIGPNQEPTDKADIVILRTQLLDWACSLSHEICKETAEQLLSVWQATPPEQNVPIPTDIQPMIYCAAVAAASSNPENTTIQEFLLQEYVRNRGERQRSLIANALACDQAAQNLQALMEKAIDKSPGNELEIAVHGLQILQNIAKNSAGREVLLEFLQKNQTEIISALGNSAVSSTISSMAPYLSSRSSSGLTQKVEDFIKNYLDQPSIPDNVRSSLQASLTKIEENSRWMNYYYEDVKNWLSNVEN